MINMKGIRIIMLFIVGGIIMFKYPIQAQISSEKTTSKVPVRVVLLGASVGQAWEIEKWPQRMQKIKYIFECIAVYDFDKTEALDEIIMRPKRKFRLTRTYLKGFFLPSPQKPNVVIIKECSGYFPGDQEQYKSLIKKWVAQCKAAGIKPIVTTVVPITAELSKRIQGKLEAIIAYNNWVKEYTRENGMDFLDLEAPLRISDTNRALRPDLTIGDGSHLNKKAYDILDNFLLQKLEMI